MDDALAAHRAARGDRGVADAELRIDVAEARRLRGLAGEARVELGVFCRLPLPCSP